MNNNCICCNSTKFEVLFDFGRLPQSGIYRKSFDESINHIYHQYEFCQECNYLTLNSNGESKNYKKVDRSTKLQFPKYIGQILEKFKQLDIEKDDFILEIGSNDGIFLCYMSDSGYVNTLGIEPSEELAYKSQLSGNKVIQDFFGEGCANNILNAYGRPKLVICRHTIEHIPNLNDFFSGLEILGINNSIIYFFEIPDSSAITKQMNVYELWDEHIHYFNLNNFKILAARYNIEIFNSHCQEHLDTKNLLLWGKPSIGLNTVNINQLKIHNSVICWRLLKEKWIKFTEHINLILEESEKPIFVIGASHSQTNFINYSKIEKFIDFFIDDDSMKVSTIAPIKTNKARIISTNNFITNFKNGTVLMTGFGYQQWSKFLSDHALSNDMTLIKFDKQDISIIKR